MTRPSDGIYPAWDATAPASGRDALAVATADTLSTTDTALSATADTLSATGTAPSADALAVGYGTDALGSPAAGGPLSVLGADYWGDPLTAYGDATAVDRADRRATGRRAPRPGPVPPAAAEDRSPDDAGGRTAGRAPSPGPAAAGRAPSPGPAAAGRERRAGSTPSPRRTPRPGARASTAATARPATGSSAGRTSSGTSRTGSPGTGSGTGRAAYPAAGSGSRTGYPGSGSGTGRAGAAGAGSGTGRAAYPAAGSGTGRAGSSGRSSGSGEWYGGPPHDVPAPRGRGSVPTPPPWANRTTRPTGTVPWAGGSRRSGWDDFLAGMGGDGSGKQPSGAEVARALLDAWRRSRRDR
jgi:hypothetical protein